MSLGVVRNRTLEKPQRGSGILAREKADAERKAHEREIARQVKTREGYRCRWPERHTCRGGPLESAHIVDKSLAGATSTDNEIAVCPWIHRRGPESIHGKQLRVEKDTPRGADGPVSFWRQTGEYDTFGEPIYHCIARETARGVLERD